MKHDNDHFSLSQEDHWFVHVRAIIILLSLIGLCVFQNGQFKQCYSSIQNSTWQLVWKWVNQITILAPNVTSVWWVCQCNVHIYSSPCTIKSSTYIIIYIIVYQYMYIHTYTCTCIPRLQWYNDINMVYCCYCCYCLINLLWFSLWEVLIQVQGEVCFLKTKRLLRTYIHV